LILTPIDPRIYFALVCESRSCAPINYYDHDNINKQLDEASESFVNSSEVIVLPEEGKVLISDIFSWYSEDFGRRRGILDFIFDYLSDNKDRRFIRSNPNPETLQIEYLQYDWNLNR
jgi:hypothetical protein